MIDILIKNATVVTVDNERKIIYDGAIAVKEDRIIDVGKSYELEGKYSDVKKIIDGTGKIIFPGFINTHTHLFQTLLKGLGDDMVLKDWLATMTFPAACYLTEEDCYDAAMLGCVEGLHSGITTMVDYMYPHNRPNLSDSVIKAFKDLKIRGIFGRGCMDEGDKFGVPDGIVQSVEEVEKDVRRLFETYHNTENGRIKIWVAPAAIWSNSEEMLTMLWDITNEYNSGFTVHVSETPFDRDAGEVLHGVPDAEVLQKLGILGPNVLMVHCVYLTDRDIRMAKEHDLKVSHNPVSNMYLSSGVARIPKMIEAGIGVSLGVDGAASNNSQDMLELMKSTALLQKVHTLDPTIITAEKVLELATIEGARCIGMEDEIGSIEIGKKADLVIFNPYATPKSIPVHNPVSTLVYSSSMENIETVIVDGNIVMKDKVITTIEDESKLVEKVQETANNLAERAGITNRRSGHVWRSTAY